MNTSATLEALELPPQVREALRKFVESAASAFGAELCSVVLYGSAAEGKYRPTSDINLILVLTSFDQSNADALREPLRTAHAAIQLRPMFLLANEIGAASQAFAQKFADILRRRRVLCGDDPFTGLSIAREKKILQLNQQSMNLVLRLRAFYVSRSLREEQLVLMIADFAGPLRSCAALLAELEGQAAASAKQALERVAASLGDASWQETLRLVSQARETRSLPPGQAGHVFFRLIELAQQMRMRAAALA